MSDTHEVPNRYDWVIEMVDDKSLKKESLVRLYVKQNLLRTTQIFDYDGLPDTIPKKDLEILLQCYGSATIAKVDGKLYAFRAQLGGTPNPYYLPTLAIVANPALNFNASMKIDEECVVMLNDDLYLGLLPLINKNACLLAECDISFKFAAVNMRLASVINVKSDVEKESAEEFLSQIEKGEKLGVIASDEFQEDFVQMYPYTSSSNLIQHLIELKQYIIGSFYQDLGIQASFNMKREAINEAEAGMNEDILYPTIDDMLNQRKIAVDKINAMFGTKISVRLSSIWETLRKKEELSVEVIESEIDKNLNADKQEEAVEEKTEVVEEGDSNDEKN